jgi:hypothetical protein
MTAEEITRVVSSLQDLMSVLAAEDPADKAQIYMGPGCPAADRRRGASGAKPSGAAPADLGDQGQGGATAQRTLSGQESARNRFAASPAPPQAPGCVQQIPAWDDSPYRFPA